MPELFSYWILGFSHTPHKILLGWYFSLFLNTQADSSSCKLIPVVCLNLSRECKWQTIDTCSAIRSADLFSYLSLLCGQLSYSRVNGDRAR